MKKMKWAITEESVFAAFLFVVACLFLWTERNYPAQSKLFPTLVLIPLLAGSLWVAIRGARIAADAEDTSARTRYEFGITAGWMAALLLLIALTGLVGSMVLFPLLYMRFYCREAWRPTLITTAIVGIGSWAFIVFLHIVPYSGVIVELLWGK
jgi:hypothetical protein